MQALARGPSGKNVIFSNTTQTLLSVLNCSTMYQYDILKVSFKKIVWKGSIGGVKVDIFAVWDKKWAQIKDFFAVFEK